MKFLRHNPSLRIPFIYALFGLAWILLTDRLLLWFAPDLKQLVRWQTLKGWLFVTLSTLIIFLLLLQAQRRQRKTEAQQRQSENLYRLLFDNNPLPMWVYDVHTLAFLKVNNAAIAKYGYSRAEFRQMSLRDIRPAEDVGRLEEDVAQTTDTLNFAGEWRHRRKDGSVFPVEIISHALTFETRPARLVIANDITERKRAEAALRESERQFRRAVEEAPFPIIIHAEDGEILALNQAWAELSGYTRAEVPTMSAWTERAYGERQKAIQEGIEQLYELERRVDEGEFTLTTKAGERRIWAFSSTSLGRLPDGRRSVISMAADVTERKKVENALRDSEARYRALFRQLRQVMDSVPEGVLLLKPGGEVMDANPQARAALSRLAGADLGDTVTHLGKQPLKAVLAAPPPGTWHEVQAGGRTFDLLGHPLTSGPVSQGWVLVVRDVTEERKVAQQVERQARLAAIGQLAAGIAHDFNNIINVILLYTDLLRSEAALAEKARQRLDTINQQAHQAASLVEQILDFGRRALLEPKPLDLLALLQEQVTLLQRVLPTPIKVTFTTQLESCVTRADVTRIRQVLMNLGLNARDAMPEGGELAFTLSRATVASPEQAPVPGMAMDEWIRLDISDTGRGIPPELLEHIFEPFFTTKGPGKGTGLGLAQTHGIVGQHGGHIVVASEVGVGTTFTIYLPA